MQVTRVLLLVACCASALARPRALLIGINDYSASGLPSLSGAVNDVQAMRELLVARYGFEVVVLTDRAATREAILRAIATQLTGENNFFYYAGHGSQVRNSRSDEPDQLDESIVAADAARADIRDKELRRLFNRILDRGARLTVMIDACHSGSGARGAHTHVRGVAPDLRDVADASEAGPRPEDRGALVLSASQDFDDADETRDERKQIHGAFTLAWLRALRPDEPANTTFARARAILQATKPYQHPVLAGDARAPFLMVERQASSPVVFCVSRVRNNTAIVQSHLPAGTTLRTGTATLTITASRNLAESEARIDRGTVTPGTLATPDHPPAPRWPAQGTWPYHLAIRRNGALVTGHTLHGGARYQLVLTGHPPSPVRYIYVFVIDPTGRSILLFPRRTTGSIENRFPIANEDEIPLTPFRVAPPYGDDTYVLVTSDEPLPDLAIFEQEGARSPLPPGWSIERTVWRSAP
jgi:Caspase domain